MGWAFLNTKDYDQAFAHFREALRLDPESEFARRGVIEAIKAKNRFYALTLAYFLWMERLGSKGFVFVIGLYIAVQVIARSADSLPPWGQVAVTARTVRPAPTCIAA